MYGHVLFLFLANWRPSVVQGAHYIVITFVCCATLAVQFVGALIDLEQQEIKTSRVCIERKFILLTTIFILHGQMLNMFLLLNGYILL